MKEIYSSFEGKLSVDNRSGYTVSLTDTNKIVIEFLSIYTDQRDGKWMLECSEKYNENTKWDYELCAEVTDAIHCGRIDGYTMVGGKWQHN